MAFLIKRKGSRFWWMCWTDANGVEQRASSNTEDKAEAQAVADELERDARAHAHAHRTGITVL